MTMDFLPSHLKAHDHPYRDSINGVPHSTLECPQMPVPIYWETFLTELPMFPWVYVFTSRDVDTFLWLRGTIYQLIYLYTTSLIYRQI